MRPFIIALWSALLFLPFRGVVPSLVLFAVILSAGLVWRPLTIAVGAFFTRMRAGRWRKALPHISTRHALLGLFAFLLLFPFLFDDYAIDIAVLAGIYVILALGLNVVVGFAGLLNLGFVAFYAIGAYSYALINTRLGLGFWPSLPLSLIMSALFGLLLAIPALRLRGDYLAIVTLGFGEMTRLLLNNWDSLTNGPNGITGIAPPYLAGVPLGALREYFYVVLAFVVLTVVVISRVFHSRTGRAWVAIRENEIAASSMGINVTAYKLYAFAFGAFWAGLAGVLFSAKMRFVSPESFTFMESVFILCMVILGGMGSIPGPIIGAVVLVALPELLRGVELYRMLALGAGLVLLAIFRPQGIFGGLGGGLGGGIGGKKGAS